MARAPGRGTAALTARTGRDNCQVPTQGHNCSPSRAAWTDSRLAVRRIVVIARPARAGSWLPSASLARAAASTTSPLSTSAPRSRRAVVRCEVPAGAAAPRWAARARGAGESTRWAPRPRPGPWRGAGGAGGSPFFFSPINRYKRYTIRDYTRYLYIDLKILRRGGSVARPSLLKIHSQPVARGLRRPLATRQRHEIWAPARRCGVSRRSAGSTTSAACPPTPPRPHGHVDRPPTRGCAR